MNAHSIIYIALCFSKEYLQEVSDLSLSNINISVAQNVKRLYFVTHALEPRYEEKKI
jgi:hypothetical protein